MKRFYLNVPYADKDKVKSLGARWDNDVRKWYYEGVKEDRHFSLWQMKEALTYEELSDEQKAFINLALTGKNVLVDACIGSGKTTAIQVLCNTVHDKNILYLTYNRLLKLDAQDKIMSSNVIVQNYHGFAYEVLKTRYEQNVTLGIPDLIQTFNHLKPDVSGIDLLILDEYQDIYNIPFCTYINICRHYRYHTHDQCQSKHRCHNAFHQMLQAECRACLKAGKDMG